jgi:hypothetical protein
MPDPLRCHRCGASLAALSLPLTRLDECPECRAQLHVCRMCTHYAPQLADACDEDDAPDVRDKSSANFCDYFRPNALAYVALDDSAEAAARARLDELFGADVGAPKSSTSEPAQQDGRQGGHDESKERARRAAEALFKR